MKVIYEHAGRDATASYTSIHAPSLLPNNLSPSAYKGTLDTTTISTSWSKPRPATNPTLIIDKTKPPLHTLLSLHDFETVASNTLSAKTWAFYSSAATDLITRDANRSTFDRIWFRPRVMRNVRDVDTRTRLLGVGSEMPVFVSPAALAKLVHPEGEKGIARGCREKGIIQCVRWPARIRTESGGRDMAGLMSEWVTGLHERKLSNRGNHRLCTLPPFLLPTLRQQRPRENRGFTRTAPLAQ